MPNYILEQKDGYTIICPNCKSTRSPRKDWDFLCQCLDCGRLANAEQFYYPYDLVTTCERGHVILLKSKTQDVYCRKCKGWIDKPKHDHEEILMIDGMVLNFCPSCGRHQYLYEAVHMEGCYYCAYCNIIIDLDGSSTYDNVDVWNEYAKWQRLFNQEWINATMDETTTYDTGISDYEGYPTILRTFYEAR